MIGDLRQRQPAKLTGGRGRVTRVYATGTCHVADRGAIADAAGQAVRANACRRACARGPTARRPLRACGTRFRPLDAPLRAYGTRFRPLDAPLHAYGTRF